LNKARFVSTIAAAFLILASLLLPLGCADSVSSTTNVSTTISPSRIYTFDGHVPADYTPPPVTIDPDKSTIVVTHTPIASVVKMMFDSQTNVVTLIPNGEDISSWQPTDENITMLDQADLIIENGLGLEAGLLPVLDAERAKGKRFFTVSDYVNYHLPDTKEWPPYIPIDQSQQIVFPYVWMDPYAMLNYVYGLYDFMIANFNIDAGRVSGSLVMSFGFIDQHIQSLLQYGIPPENRTIITDQDPLRICSYMSPDYKVIVLDLPGLRDSDTISKANLNTIKKAFAQNTSPAIFLRPGVPDKVAKAITEATGAIVVQFDTYATTYQVYEGEIVDRGDIVADIFLIGLGNALVP
jgi:ABC-type Zn uptake system ZnuABC Zn-binding protein ZnuA